MNRLLSKSTIKTLAENFIFVSEEIETLYTYMSGNLTLILDNLLFEEEDEVKSELERHDLYDKIMYNFMSDSSTGKFTNTTQGVLKNLSFLKRSPNALANFENTLADPEFLAYTFEKWNKVLNSSELVEKMTQILK